MNDVSRAAVAVPIIVIVTARFVARLFFFLILHLVFVVLMSVEEPLVGLGPQRLLEAAASLDDTNAFAFAFKIIVTVPAIVDHGWLQRPP